MAEFTPALQTMIDRVRFYTNEASVEAKYTDSRLWDIIRMKANEVMTDVRFAQENPLVVRHRITLEDSKYIYGLPPYVGEIIRMGDFDADNNGWNWSFEPRNRLNPIGPGVEFMGPQMLRIGAGMISAGGTFDVEFIPNGELLPHASTIPGTNFGFHDDSDDDNTDQFILGYEDSQILVGEFDRRPNAYLGQVLRIYDGPTSTGGGPAKAFFPISEHLITAYNHDTTSGALAGPIATVEPSFPTWWADTDAGDWSYEIVPLFGKSYMDLITLKSTIFVTALELPERVKTLELEYKKAKRSLLLSWSNFQAITGRNFASDVHGNDKYLPWALM